MGICVPKPVVCNWYIPTFTPSAVDCVLPSYNESRARLVAGNVVWRSIDAGPSENDITVQVEWLDGSGDVTTFELLCETVRLTVTKNAVVEVYTAAQSASIGTMGTVWVSGIPSLRSQLDSSSTLVTIPIEDGETGLAPGPPGTPIIEQVTPDFTQQVLSTISTGDHLDIIDPPQNLSGGVGGPTDASGLAAIRTGPAYSMIHIAESDVNSDVGIPQLVNETRYWNGACFVDHDPANPSCEDPDNPPASCGLGPLSDC